MSAVDLLEGLKQHSTLRYLTLDGIITLSRLIQALKRDILQPQPFEDSNPAVAPRQLPKPIALFLGACLGLNGDLIDACWSIMAGYLWELPLSPLIHDDYQLFKMYGWQYGLSEF